VCVSVAAIELPFFAVIDVVVQAFKAKMSADSAAVMGSGWGWLVYNVPKDSLQVVTTANQDLVSTDASIVPLLGIDVRAPIVVRPLQLCVWMSHFAA
jgi:hypothetical protein